MIFGLSIDNDYLKKHPDYKHKPVAELTAFDRSKVAMQQRATYEDKAVKYLAETAKAANYGTATMVRIYNGTGDPLTLKDTALDWHGGPYDAVDGIIMNGQWSAFLHVKAAACATGSSGGLAYTGSNHGFFAGWSTPFNYNHWNGCAYAEVCIQNQFFDIAKKDDMASVVNKHDHGATTDFGIFRANATIGNADINPCCAVFFIKLE